MISFGLIAFAGSNTQERLLHESNIESVQGGHGVTMVVPRQVEDTSTPPQACRSPMSTTPMMACGSFVQSGRTRNTWAFRPVHETEGDAQEPSTV